MSTELVSRSILETYSQGSVLIDQYWITTATAEEFLQAEDLVYSTIENNPDYEFATENQPDGSIVLKWRKK